MSSHIEWVAAADGGPIFHHAASIANLAPDGNRGNHVGLWIGDEDGAMLYGTVRDLVTWLGLAVERVQTAHRSIQHQRWVNTERDIKAALSRDDETDFGSIFEDKVQVIRNLNSGVFDDGDDVNQEYARGQVELLMDTTDWMSEMRPEKEDVFFYIFKQDMV